MPVYRRDGGCELFDFSDSPGGIRHEVTDPDAIAQLEKMLDMMDENEDIQEVFHNWNG